jgi:hypothetical protein
VGNPHHAVHNVPVVRLPEIYLTLAEAYLKAGNYAKALEYTSLVTQARCNEPANIRTFNDFYEERRRELMLEGHTFWDHFRTARNMTGRQSINYMNDVTITFGSTTGASYRAVYPIPLAELNINPNIRDQQNPGYGPWYLSLGDDEE